MFVVRLPASSGWEQTVAAVLKAEEPSFGHSGVNRTLKKQGLIRSGDPLAATWIPEIFVADDPLLAINADPVGVNTPIELAQSVRHGRLRPPKKAMVMIANLKTQFSASVEKAFSACRRLQRA